LCSGARIANYAEFDFGQSIELITKVKRIHYLGAGKTMNNRIYWWRLPFRASSLVLAARQSPIEAVK
jgi:hypothetical protein